MLCSASSYINKVNQLAVFIYPLPLEPPPTHPVPHPTSLGHQRAIGTELPLFLFHFGGVSREEEDSMSFGLLYCKGSPE